MEIPIALFAYSRVEHLKKTVEALKKNPTANNFNLIIFSDAPKTSTKEQDVKNVRNYIKTITGFKNVFLIHRHENLGLSKSIIDGVGYVLNSYESVIVIEDDIITSPHFLEFMVSGLKRFFDDERVISIHGYLPPLQTKLKQPFFLRGADCWGWATWRRGWELFNQDGANLLDQLRREKYLHQFDYDGTFKFSKMLEDQIVGKNDSWAIRWHASAFLLGKLTLYPNQSLVQNIGNDNTGSHCTTSSSYDVCLSDKPITVSDSPIEVIESVEARQAFRNYYKQVEKRTTQKILRIIKNAIKTLYNEAN